MLTDIEEAIAAHLKDRLESVSRIEIDQAHSPTSLKLPGVDVIMGNGAFARVAQHYKITAQVFVVATFQNLKSVADRRRGVYPIMEALVALLVGRTFDLAIDPLRPKRLDHITEEQEALEGKVVFQLEFETGFIISAASDEEAKDLLRIGLNYYLQDPADDDSADATDEITLGS
ncbi:MAG: DUF1834 family protein [Deltaproteobacteria bacterium]|nr:DUF1834 family protein [Deltaproteobacteria bacterium]